jgi:hypothetical protein
MEVYPLQHKRDINSDYLLGRGGLDPIERGSEKYLRIGSWYIAKIKAHE